MVCLLWLAGPVVWGASTQRAKGSDKKVCRLLDSLEGCSGNRSLPLRGTAKTEKALSDQWFFRLRGKAVILSNEDDTDRHTDRPLVSNVTSSSTIEFLVTNVSQVQDRQKKGGNRCDSEQPENHEAFCLCVSAKKVVEEEDDDDDNYPLVKMISLKNGEIVEEVQRSFFVIFDDEATYNNAVHFLKEHKVWEAEDPRPSRGISYTMYVSVALGLVAALVLGLGKVWQSGLGWFPRKLA